MLNICDLPEIEEAELIAEIFSDILNCMVKRGELPHIWKIEMVAPALKVYPLTTVNDLRKSSGLKNVSTIIEKTLGGLRISDMAKSKSFVQNGVKRPLIPLLINYYQGR